MQRAAAPPQPPRPARLRNENPGAAGIFSFHPLSACGIIRVGSLPGAMSH